jgi:hypothetical protein
VLPPLSERDLEDAPPARGEAGATVRYGHRLTAASQPSGFRRQDALPTVIDEWTAAP